MSKLTMTKQENKKSVYFTLNKISESHSQYKIAQFLCFTLFLPSIINTQRAENVIFSVAALK